MKALYDENKNVKRFEHMCSHFKIEVVNCYAPPFSLRNINIPTIFNIVLITRGHF
jgi:hypothetical protein